MTKPDTDTLEALFQDARAAPPAIPDGLIDRILADARTEHPAPLRRTRRTWRTLWNAIGGAPAIGGMITATSVGFWIGVAGTGSLPDLAMQMITSDAGTAMEDQSLSELTAFGWDLEEG